MEEVQRKTGFAVEYFKTYSALGQNLLEYFDNSDNISQARAADFLPCNASRLSSNNTIFPYWKATGDDEGVVVDKNTYTAFCPDGYLWRAPSCRSPEKECILYVTSGDGWGMENIMQQISAFSMPLAVGVAEWENYLRLPKAYWMLTYAWSPDDSFLDLRLEQLIFPAHNAYAWSIGDLTSAGDSLRLANIVSYDMGFLAPDLLELLEKSRLDIDTIYDLMRKRKAMQASPREVACQWLKDNEQRWRPWIPDPTACSRGFGLYNELEEDFCQSRANAESCKACLPGTYSKPFQDARGTTYVCSTCPPGMQQPAAGEVACQPCPAGTVKQTESREMCAPCRQSLYQDEMGGTHCKACPEGTTTLLVGAELLSQCVCEEGSIDVSAPEAAQICVTCGEGLLCPDGSTLEQLASQEGGLEVPQVAPGYFSWPDHPLEVYKCAGSHCPGGRPGTCDSGALGPTCSNCPEGMYWDDDACRECEVALAPATWTIVPIGVIVAMVVSYYFAERYIAKASLAECARLSMEIMINFVQNLGILSLAPVPWPDALRKLLEFSEVFVLKVQSFGIHCATRSDMEQYIFISGTFVSIVVAGPLLGLCTQLVPLRRRGLSWDFYRTLCATGKLLQALFVTMCNVGLGPFMCYLHPNGRRSMLKHPNTLCSSPDHEIMQWASFAVLFLSLTLFILCCWSVAKAPTWSLTSPDRLSSIGFLTANFRPSSWWFGLVILARGPILSLGPVIAPNAEALQILVMSCTMLISLCLQLWFLPWKVPLLNLVDAVSTALFLLLLGVSLHFAPVSDSREFMDACGALAYFLSLGVIAMVALVSFGLFAVERCSAKAKRKVSSHSALANLGKLPSSEEMVKALQAIGESLGKATDAERQLLVKKMSSLLSVYDINIVGQALLILSIDCELQSSSFRWHSSTRIRAKRVSQMTRRSLVFLHGDLDDDNQIVNDYPGEERPGDSTREERDDDSSVSI